MQSDTKQFLFCALPLTSLGLTVLVGGLEDPEVGCAGDAPGGVLHVVALPVDGAVLVRKAEGGLDVGAHLGQHRLLDRDTLHLAPNLRRV